MCTINGTTFRAPPCNFITRHGTNKNKKTNFTHEIKIGTVYFNELPARRSFHLIKARLSAEL